MCRTGKCGLPLVFFNANEYSARCRCCYSPGRKCNWRTGRRTDDTRYCCRLSWKDRQDPESSCNSSVAARIEPLRGYLTLAQHLYEEGPAYAEGWNFGPNDEDAKAGRLDRREDGRDVGRRCRMAGRYRRASSRGLISEAGYFQHVVVSTGIRCSI